MKIFKGNYGWQTLAKGKTQSGEELKKYIDVRFSKKLSEPVGNEANVELTKWFPSLFKRKNGEIDVSFMVMEFKYEENHDQEQKAKQFANDNAIDYSDIKPDDLPFY